MKVLYVRPLFEERRVAKTTPTSKIPEGYEIIWNERVDGPMVLPEGNINGIIRVDDMLGFSQVQLDVHNNLRAADEVLDPISYRKYESVSEQLDKLWHDIDNGVLTDKINGTWFQSVKAVKDKFPK